MTTVSIKDKNKLLQTQVSEVDSSIIEFGYSTDAKRGFSLTSKQNVKKCTSRWDARMLVCQAERVDYFK